MAVLQFVVYDILGEASLLIGLMAMVGLLIQRKPAEKVIAGTIKTIVGFLIFGIGSSAAQGALNGFQSLFVTAFGLEGVTPISEAITAQAQTLFPMVIALIMVGGFVCNLVIAKLTKFKYIFLTGGHSLFLSALLAILLKALGLSDVAAILIGSGDCPEIHERGHRHRRDRHRSLLHPGLRVFRLAGKQGGQPGGQHGEDQAARLAVHV